MRPTAEGVADEENREKQKQEARQPQASPAPPPPEDIPFIPEPANLEPASPEPQPEWHVEPVSPPPAPIFAETETEFVTPRALPFAEPDDEDEGELEAEEAEEGGEELEAEAAEKEEEKEEGKGRRKRSRRRGGRRKNGRTAATAAEPAEEEDEEDEEPYQEPVEEPRRVAPAPAAPQARMVTMPAPAPRAVRESYVLSPTELESREIIISVPDRQRTDVERKIAMFCDFENIALGVRDSEIGKFDINMVLERLLEKGKIIVKKAYADWERYSDYKRPFHEAAIELIDIPQKFYSGKNSADIKMVVDAMDLSYSKEHLDTFVILSGDSDFSPLVSKLKENNKYVIGVGVKNSSSNLLVDNCDEFIYYEDVWRDSQKGPKLDGLNKKTAEAFSLMIESIQALARENKDVLWGSMIKQTMQRKKPSFNEGYYGYSTFSELLEDAERKNIIKLKKDQRSGTYIVTGFAKTGESVAAGGRR
jgi:uncharacterized protein (TIGR00288 family)